MKNFFKSLAICALAALTFASCQKENADGNMDDQSSVVSINLTSPLMGTKAFADGKTVDVVHVHVYKVGADNTLTYIAPGTGGTETPSKDVTMRSSGTATYSTRLVTGQKYTFVFWAEKKNNGHYTYNPTTKTITVTYGGTAGNDETRDAFYAVLPNVTITGAYSNSVTLQRPFAQVNFGVTQNDMDATNAAGITVNKAAVECTNVANQLNLLDGRVSGSEDVAFASADLPSETLSAANKTYKYVAMNYVLVGKNASTLSNITLTLEASGATSATPKYTYTNVPLQGNYRTNIVGDLFTSPASINITVDSGFEGDINKNVSSVDAANEAFENGATNVCISAAEDGDPETIVLPNTIKSVTLTIENYPATRNLTIEYSSVPGAAKPASLTVTAPNAQNITINCPETHVEVNGVTATSITASTSDNTLVIGRDVTVGTLTVNKGAAIIKGAVTNVIRGPKHTGNIEWHVKSAAEFKEAVKVANMVILEQKIELESSAIITNGAVITIDLNGNDITAPSKVLGIANAKVNIVGSGKIYETEDDQFGALLLSGSNEDVADYTVVNIGKQVVLAGWSGIFVAKDIAGGYKNYGIVVNCKGTLQNPGMESHNKPGNGVYINGSNKNTNGNVPKFNFEGSTFSSKGVGIYAAGYAEWKLDNCNITGAETAIEIRAGKMTIDGGNYTSTKNPFEVAPNGNGTTTSGAALGISQHTTNLPMDGTVKGGTFSGAYAIWEKDVQDETAREQIKLTVNNGTFNGAIYSQNNPNAIVKGTYSDPAALNYLADDADVKIDVQQDVNSGFFTLPASAKAEIALNGKRVTFTAASESGHGSKIYGNLVISGSGYIGDPTHSTVGYLFDMYKNSTLLVEGDATIESGLTSLQLSDNAHATVKGGKWIGDEWNNKYWTINKIDSSKDSAVVEVMGGEFYKFDPSNSATENPVQNWVPEGYTVTSENDWYKVRYKVTAE